MHTDRPPSHRPLEFGVLFQAADARTIQRRAARAEALGFDLLGMGDSQLLFREVYMSLTVAALATQRIRLGPTVTNPLTRHDTVTAQALATLQELSGGRAFLGIGSGDSSALSIGLRAASPERMAELARTVRALVAGEEVDFGAVRGRLRWSHQQAPIFFSGDGPRVLRTAGMVADGVILGGGLDEATLQRSLRLLAEGAASAGRDPQTLERWIFAKVSFGATEAEALEPLRATLAAACQRNFRHNPVARGLPPALVPAAQAVIAQYAFGRHGDTDAAGNARLLTDPDLMRFLADRFALYGTPAQVRQQIARIAAAGFHQFLLVCSGPDPDTLLEALGHEIVAPFRARSAG